MKKPEKKVLLSGSAPSGNLTIGNYLGAIKNWVRLKDEYVCLFLIVDMHAITVRQDPKKLKEKTYEMVGLYLACGLDPEENVIFIQSHVSTHAELTWILNCFTYPGELSRMTQFKDKSKKQEENVTVGLYDYPVLMAADILLYQTDLVPVGEDQKQHLELTRDIAIRFNNIYPNVFTVPEVYIPPTGARIKSLQNPESKMSKSDEDPKGSIYLIDPPDVVRSKIKQAVTDSGTEIAYDEEKKPAISNLLVIYNAITDEPMESIIKRYEGKGYAQFKSDLADVVIEYLRPVHERYKEYRKDNSYISKVLSEGAEKAYYRSKKTLDKVYHKIGFIPRDKKPAFKKTDETVDKENNCQ